MSSIRNRLAAAPLIALALASSASFAATPAPIPVSVVLASTPVATPVILNVTGGGDGEQITTFTIPAGQRLFSQQIS